MPSSAPPATLAASGRTRLLFPLDRARHRHLSLHRPRHRRRRRLHLDQLLHPRAVVARRHPAQPAPLFRRRPGAGDAAAPRARIPLRALFTASAGIPGSPACRLIWLVYASGIGGYWLVWDQLGQFSAVASAEWFDWLPIFSRSGDAQLPTPGVLTDRFFSLLVFLHIGIPLTLMLALWVHIQRVSQADVFPSRALALGTFAMLLVLAFVKPTVSHGRADLSVVPTVLHIDWYYLFIHPLMYLTSPAGLWADRRRRHPAAACPAAAAARKQEPIAVVNPPNCNGCRRCFVDCPYGAIAMLPHPDKPGHELAQRPPRAVRLLRHLRRRLPLVDAVPQRRAARHRHRHAAAADRGAAPGHGAQDRRPDRAGENRRLWLRMRRRRRRGGRSAARRS